MTVRVSVEWMGDELFSTTPVLTRNLSLMHLSRGSSLHRFILQNAHFRPKQRRADDGASTLALRSFHYSFFQFEGPDHVKVPLLIIWGASISRQLGWPLVIWRRPGAKLGLVPPFLYGTCVETVSYPVDRPTLLSQILSDDYHTPRIH